MLEFEKPKGLSMAQTKAARNTHANTPHHLRGGVFTLGILSTAKSARFAINKANRMGTKGEQSTCTGMHSRSMGQTGNVTNTVFKAKVLTRNQHADADIMVYMKKVLANPEGTLRTNKVLRFMQRYPHHAHLMMKALEADNTKHRAERVKAHASLLLREYFKDMGPTERKVCGPRLVQICRTRAEREVA